MIAVYGLVQYVNPPAWDGFWVLNSGLLTQGVAEPFGLRIFGPMNSSGPYSVMLICCALVALSTGTRLSFLCIVTAMPALFLTLVRSSLGGLVIGVVFLIFSLKGRQRRNLLVGVMALMLAAVPFALMQEAANGVTKLLSSITDLKDDASFEARTGVYDKFFNEMQVNFLGKGLGVTGVGSKLSSEQGAVLDFDSGVLEVPYVLGWPGTILFGADIVARHCRADGLHEYADWRDGPVILHYGYAALRGTAASTYGRGHARSVSPERTVGRIKNKCQALEKIAMCGAPHIAGATLGSVKK
ncbi:Glucose-6-phosphate isomerase [Candidatus Burkholderia brachyanthoides]|nr:Glucose-6-phosphate isomerase [Candidatus Burkholderia brachyanthoides]